MQFDSPDLLDALVASSPQHLNTLDFGVVKMDLANAVTFYNTFESDLSGMSPESVHSKNFFTEVAPCTNNFLVAAKYEDAEKLDETLDYVFTYRMAPTKVRLRLLRDAGKGVQYLCVHKP